MLKHPTGERLIALGLKGMAQALEEQKPNPTSPISTSRNASRSWLIERPRRGKTNGSSAG